MPWKETCAMEEREAFVQAWLSREFTMSELCERFEVHHTPKHASWLNMAEVEIGVMEKQCTGRRISTETLLLTEVAAWQQNRNGERRGIQWAFTREKADAKLGHRYVS